MTERSIKVLVKGKAVGRALKSDLPLSFLGGIEPKTGRILDRTHPLFGKNVKGRILLIPFSKGSTVGSYVIYSAKRADTAPAAILSKQMDMITATGCVLAKIPLMIIDEEMWSMIGDGELIEVDANSGTLRKLMR